MDKLKFPIGKYTSHKKAAKSNLGNWINTIDSFYTRLKETVGGLNEEQLQLTYRPSSLTVRQLVHHLADSHMNAFIRFKLALTEEKPTIKPYNEAGWAKLCDYNEPIDTSLKIIEGVHIRWVNLLTSMKEEDYKKIYLHPEFASEFDLTEAVCQYDWHCKHHLAHIKLAINN
jgi:DinB family protein